MLESLIKSFAEEHGLPANYPREDIIRMMLEAGEIVESDIPGNYRIPEYDKYLDYIQETESPAPDEDDSDGSIFDGPMFDEV